MCFVSPYFYCARLTVINIDQSLETRIMAFDVDEFEDRSALTVPN